MKTLAIIALATATAFTALPAFAQQGGGDGPRQSGLEQVDREALVDARIAAIRAGLRLTAEQEPLFAPVEQAIRDSAQQRMERWGEMRERRAEMREMSREERREQRAERQAEHDFMDRLQMRADRAGEQATQLGTLASAMNPLWDSLDENQQRLLPVLMRDTMGGRGGHRMAGYQHGGQHGMMGHHGGRGEGRGEGRGMQR
ncbi:MAG TPA: hypothetical protein VLQ65_04645 [Saliniramus sp.]|nr:hypothetical protein [Saliniramus sp.]